MTELKDIPSLKERAAAFVETYTGIDRTDLISHRRQQDLVRARALFVWCVRWSRPETTYSTIGVWLRRDPSSILHLAQKAENLIMRDARKAGDRDRVFARLCGDWKATERARMEVPHACA